MDVRKRSSERQSAARLSPASGQNSMPPQLSKFRPRSRNPPSCQQVLPWLIYAVLGVASLALFVVLWRLARTIAVEKLQRTEPRETPLGHR